MEHFTCITCTLPLNALVVVWDIGGNPMHNIYEMFRRILTGIRNVEGHKMIFIFEFSEKIIF